MPQPAKAERRPQRQAAHAMARRAALRRRRIRTGMIAGSALLAAVLVLALVLVQQRADAVPIGTRVADEGGGHVADTATLTYKHTPPTSGKHYASPAPAGFSATPIKEGNYVHSLEHGYVVILYQPSADSATQQRLRTLMTAFPKAKYGSVKLVVAPSDTMPNLVTALAWNRELTLDQFNQDQLLQFYQAYVDHGTEDVA